MGGLLLKEASNFLSYNQQRNEGDALEKRSFLVKGTYCEGAGEE